LEKSRATRPERGGRNSNIKLKRMKRDGNQGIRKKGKMGALSLKNRKFM